jgi:hypothetical protein
VHNEMFASGVEADLQSEPILRPPAGGNFCSLHVGNGNGYVCSPEGSSGSSYDDQFYDTNGNPRTDVLGGVNDGGYGSDDRAISTDISKVDANIAARLNDLDGKLNSVKGALPGWLEGNRVATEQLVAATNEKRSDEVRQQEAFATAMAPQIAASRVAIEAFVASPTDPQRLNRLVASIGGSDFQLLGLPDDALVPGVPVINGFSVGNRLYPNISSELSQEIVREGRKANRDLSLNIARLNLSKDILRVSTEFAGGGTALAKQCANALLTDAANVRFFERGELTSMTLSDVNSIGAIGRGDWPTGKSLPATSLLGRAETLDASEMAFSNQYQSLKGTLRLGDPTDTRRGAIADSASAIALTAESEFYSGQLRDGESLLRLAHSVLDIATRFVPGVNLGRDVYEAVSGVDLFTGQPLDALGRTGAVLGVLTLGFEDEIEGGLEALKIIGVSAEREIEIISASKTIEGSGLEMSEHAIERMNDPTRMIDRSEINDAIDRGTHFWDGNKDTIVAFENDAAPGSDRVAAAIDIDSKKITTVFREPRNDDALSSVISNGRPRYTRLPPR